MSVVVEIVKLTAEDCGYSFAAVNEQQQILAWRFCYEEPACYQLCEKCGLRGS